MKSTIDSAGRLVIPSGIRKEAGLKPGMNLTVTLRNGTIEIQPASSPVKLIKKGRLTVAVPESDAGVLTLDTVEKTRDKLRKRGSSRD